MDGPLHWFLCMCFFSGQVYTCNATGPHRKSSSQNPVCRGQEPTPALRWDPKLALSAMINCRKVGVPARPDIYHQCHFQALASAPLGTKEKQSSFDDTDSHIHNYLQSPNVNPVQRALNVWSKLQDVSNAAMIIDEYPLTYLNHCSLLGHQWMLYALINNGAWNSFYDGSCLIYLLLLIEHILA